MKRGHEFGRRLTFRKHLSIVAPVPLAHLSFIDATAVFSSRPFCPRET